MYSMCPALPPSTVELLHLKCIQATAHAAHRTCPCASLQDFPAGLMATPFLRPCSLVLLFATHWPRSLGALAMCCGLGPASNKAPRSRSLIPSPRGGMGRRKYNERLVSRDKDREGSLATYGHRQNRLDLGKNKSIFNFLPIKSE